MDWNTGSLQSELAKSYKGAGGVSIEIKATQKLLNNLKRIGDADFINSFITSRLADVGSYMVDKVRDEMDRVIYSKPEKGYKRTRNLSNSVKYEVDEEDVSVTIGTDSDQAPYDVFVHWGTYKMPGRPFMLTVSEREKTFIGQTLKKDATNELKTLLE